MIKYRLHCNTENLDVNWILENNASPPHTCPNNTAHQIDLNSVVVVQEGDPIFKTNSVNALVVDKSLNFGLLNSQTLSLNTHDFGDRTTWYQKSVNVPNETLVDSGDGLTFNSSNIWWINMDSNRITYDYNLVPERNGTYSDRSTRRPVIKINGIQATINIDFTINYALGKVTFNQSQTGKTITANYWHNNNVARCSEWILCPPPQYVYILNYIEMQFSQSIQFTPIDFEMWAGGTGSIPDVYQDFNQTLYDSGYGQNKSRYIGPRDWLNICTNRASQIIPKFGDLTSDILIFPFDYLLQAQLHSNKGAVIMIRLENDSPFLSAELATGTFYMQVVPETSF